MPKNIIAQIFVTLVSISILYVPVFPAAAQDDPPTCPTLTADELGIARDTLDEWQRRFEELQTRFSRYIELQNEPAALRLIEWAAFADYDYSLFADTVPACGDYQTARETYEAIIGHVYAVSGQLLVNHNASLTSIQDMLTDLIERRTEALGEAMQAWGGLYPTLAQ